MGNGSPKIGYYEPVFPLGFMYMYSTKVNILHSLSIPVNLQTGPT